MNRLSNSDSYQHWLIAEADKKERKQISMSFIKMKDVFFNVLAIATVLAALAVIVYEVQSSSSDGVGSVSAECHHCVLS
ncbi:hypothetical protein EKN98_023680 (plasmid) [Enterobacter hormaechei subsp. xiangfangensis]|nr:hypothetical protein EKN98_023680 [Enterobacter hormaechei subsp. xiangfangensis]HAS1962752.1 hypothetical protein [Enterobacter cloacae]